MAKNIRRLAADQGIAINALADFAGVSRSQLYAALAKDRAVSIDWLAKLAKALSVEPWELLAPYKDNSPPTQK